MSDDYEDPGREYSGSTSSESGRSRKGLTLTGETFDQVVWRVGQHLPKGRRFPRCVALAIRAENCLSEDDIEGRIIHDLTEDVRRVWRKHDKAGLPMAGPCRSEDPDEESEWVQRSFWEVDDYMFNIETRAAGLKADAKVVRLLIKECFSGSASVRYRSRGATMKGSARRSEEDRGSQREGFPDLGDYHYDLDGQGRAITKSGGYRHVKKVVESTGCAVSARS